VLLLLLQVCTFFMDQCTASAGIYMHMNCNPAEIIRESDGTLTVKLAPAEKKGNDSSSSSSGCSEIRGNAQVVLAVGRAAKTKGLGLEELGVEMGKLCCCDGRYCYLQC
jgi:pyruvate/2-oxoglutarate dehydrogenase complex dihydrolipoamide dehydrogenase (E3) component